MHSRILLPLVWLLLAAAASGREIYVDAVAGSDSADGSAGAPLRSGQRAVDVASPGDVIHLGPAKGLIRQQIGLRDKEGLTIRGHGCTLTGADPLPADGWEPVSPGLVRRRMPRTLMDRHLLIVGGRAQRMGRSPSVRPAFPAPEKLRPGEFAWVDIDKQHGWLYVAGAHDNLEWSVRMAGIATMGRNRDITIEDLNCRHALNDGFNIHGDCRGLRCRRVTGYENFDEGFSAHDTCTCWIEAGRFWGNDNAVADVNQADTFYTRCEFRDSVSTEVLFSGGKHGLTDCTIVAGGRTVFSLSPGTLGRNKPDRIPVECDVLRTTMRSADDNPRPIILHGAAARFDHCELERVTLQTSAAKITTIASILNGKPL